jgi:hypothetical protein
MGIFTRRRAPSADTSGLGQTLIALRLDNGDAAPAGATLIVFNPAGHARRMAAGRVDCGEGEVAYCFHPGPYSVDLTPFAAAPEMGLRLRFAIDAANPRVTQQRFDLFLFSEAETQLTLAAMAAAVEQGVQAALAQGALDLAPCTSLEEWNVFRAGLNQLLYTRFGITVDDCVPVDLGDAIDFAAILRQRAASAPAAAHAAGSAAVAPAAAHAAGSAAVAPAAAHAAGSAAVAPASPAASPDARSPASATPPAGTHDEPAFDLSAPAGASSVAATEATPASAAASSDAAAADRQTSGLPGNANAGSPTIPAAARDAKSLRRLFLELPALSSGLRVLPLPPGLDTFQTHQSLLQRLGLVALSVNTMPSLAWAAPDQPLAAAQQQRRAEHSTAAVAALDETWSLLARLQLAAAPQWPQLLDEADRLCANLEFHLAQRRVAFGTDAGGDAGQRKEPSL